MDYMKAEAKQAAREQVSGLWAAVTTPFDATGAVDGDALLRDLDRLTGDLQVDGVFCTGVMSEFWSLTGTERRRLVEVIVDETRGKCPVLAHTGHHSAGQAIELTKHAQKVGADFVALINPHAYHGRTNLTMALTAKNMPYKDKFGPFAGEIYRMPMA